MAADRSISMKRYFAAGVITILIFLLGLLLGVVMDYERVNSLEDTYKVYDLDYRSLQLQFSLLNTFGDDKASCGAFEVAMDTAVAELVDSLTKVENYDKLSLSQKEKFDLLQRRYLLDNIRYWTVVKEAEKICDINRLAILYFYSGEHCSNCPDQGVILTYFKKKYEDQLLVFPINVDLSEDESAIKFLLKNYNISTYPSVVIGDKVYSGVVATKEELSKDICEGLNLNNGEC